MPKPLSFLQALPPYFGGKRKLIPWIFGRLASVIPQREWSNLIFLDAFSGGGSISLFAKSQGFKAIGANDLSHRAQIILQALLVNQSTRLSAQDRLLLTQPAPESKALGFIEAQYAGSVFSNRHAKALDDYIHCLNKIQCSTKQALSRLLLWHLVQNFVCMGTSIGTSNRPYAEVLDSKRDWQSLNPKRFVDGSFPKLLKPVWQELERKQKVVNAGVFRGSAVTAHQQDAIAFVAQVQGDILYLDPPYPKTLCYEKANRVLDTVLLGEHQFVESVSPFSQNTDALDCLLDQGKHIPVWLLSYGNALLSLEELIQKVKSHAPKRQVLGYAQSYQHMPHVTKNIQNQELLILAY